MFFLTVPIVLSAAVLRAGDVKLIANPGVGASSISTDELKRVFLLEKNTLDDGTRVEPVVVRGGPTHDAFLKQYLSKTDLALQTYYRSLVFTGKATMPKTLGSEADVVAYVAKTPGAIGYVSAAAATARVKILDVR